MKVVAKNRRATFDLEVVETMEAGIMLTGQEVKSCRGGHAHLAGSHVSFLGGKAVLKQAKIPPYAFASITEYDPQRDRQLLLNKREMEKLQSLTEQKGMTVVPLEVRAGKFIKLLIAIGRGRKRLDKRQRIKERDMDRKMRRGREI